MCVCEREREREREERERERERERVCEQVQVSEYRVSVVKKKERVGGHSVVCE